MKLKAEHCHAYNTVRALADWSDATLEAHGLGAGDLFFALMVEGEVQKFAKRTGLARGEVTVIIHRITGNAYVQWLYAAGVPIPTGVAA